MMKTILFALAIIFPSVFLSAQEATFLQNDSVRRKREVSQREFDQEIRIGAGFYSYSYMREIAFANQKKRELNIAAKPQSQGVYSLGFFGFVDKEWSVGVSLSLENITGKIERDVFDSSVQQTVRAYSDYKAKIFTIFPYAAKYWKQSKLVNMYSGIGLGISLKSYDINGNLNIDRVEDTQIGVGFQATALGLRYGNNYAGFAELGFGMLGLLRIGFSAGF